LQEGAEVVLDNLLVRLIDPRQLASSVKLHRDWINFSFVDKYSVKVLELLLLLYDPAVLKEST